MLDMKGASSYKLRGTKVFLSLITLICITLVICTWEKTPLLSTFLPTSEHFDVHLGMLSPVVPVEAPIVTQSGYIHQQPSMHGSFSNVVTAADPVNDEQPFMTEDFSEEGTLLDPVTQKAGQDLGIPLVGLSKEASPEERKDEHNLKLGPSTKKECNYAKGKWVADRRRPLYSGFGCKQWLSEMWACRLTQRPDFSFENYRWQPESCEMPKFEGSEFLKRMQHKTIALVGDSLGRQQFQSLMCMVTGGEESPEVQDIGVQYGLVKPRGAKRPDGWVYHFPRTNTTILYYWSASLCELEPINRSDPGTSYAMHLDRPATFLKQYLDRFDVLILNTGHHWNRGKLNANRWVMYVNGVPNTNRKIAEIWNARNFTVHSVAKWLDAQIPHHPRLKAFFRTMSPRHFVNGDWNTGGSCNNTTPLSGGSEVKQDGSLDPVTEGAVKGTRVKLLDITAISQLRDECHISKYTVRATLGVHDCLHWCLPGVPDTWNELFAAQV